MTETDIHLACKSGDLPTIKQALLEHPEKLNEKDSKVLNIQLGWSPLYRTVISNNIEATKYLLSQGANVNDFNNFGEIPLHQSADNGNCQMAQLLLDYGSNVNFQQNEGDTPLHHSAFSGNIEMVKLLLANKANANIKNYAVMNIQSGRTPLHYAVDCGYIDCVRVMMDYEADPFIQDKYNKNAFDFTNDSDMLIVLSHKPNNSEKKSLEKEKNISFVSSDNSELGPEDLYLERTSYSQQMLHGIIKTIKNESTGLSSSKSTKQNKFELKPIYDWLEKVGLNEYYELIVSAGFDSLDKLVKDHESGYKIFLSQIQKPGHRRRLMFRVFEEIKNMNIVKVSHKTSSVFKCCGGPDTGTQAFYNFPNLKDWLVGISLEAYYLNFVEAGFEDYESLMMMMNTSFAIDAFVLENEVKIKSNKDAKKILNRLEADNFHYFSRKSLQVNFDEPKSVACESCCVF